MESRLEFNVVVQCVVVGMCDESAVFFNSIVMQAARCK